MDTAEESPDHAPTADQASPERTFRISIVELEYQLARRGLGPTDLHRANGGPFNPNTISSWRTGGGRVKAGTLRELARFLREHPVDCDIDSILIRAD